MSVETFESLREAWRQGGPSAGFERLCADLLADRNYPGLFEARLMRKRAELGLPLILNGPPQDFTDEQRREYEQAQVAAAREVGELFLRDGKIDRAWPYFRALGEADAVRQALEEADPAEDAADPLIDIAFHQGVHPRRGFQWILERHGTCRAITSFGHYPGEDGRDQSAALLLDHLYGELFTNLRRAVEQVEGKPCEQTTIGELIEGRDWLFEGGNYYLDSSHVSSVVQMSLDWHEPAMLRKVLELTEYGRRLNEMYQFKGDPPFENVYEDIGIWQRALLGEEPDAAVAHFRAKLPPEPDPWGDPAGQALVRLLLELERYDEAIDVAIERLGDLDPARLSVPSPAEICQLAGRHDRLAELAESKGDILTFAAALAGAEAKA
ncbi:MAG: hypothetical protein GC160_27030 [Acidobacteria bacterium]|nr:hypothetical protein [Acidobacteriota bacterium]